MRSLLPAACFLALAACESKGKDRPIPVPMPMAPTAIAEKLRLDAGMLELPTDPVGPAGDLQGEAARFTTIDACVAEHAKLDPLVGDAIRAIGYDTFLRDTCRGLEAIKLKDLKRCDSVEVSSLRAHCQNTYAMALGLPDACAFQNSLAKDRGRVPGCVAVASRGLALCASTETYVERASCEALLTQESFRCKSLPAIDKARCEHDIERMRGFLSGQKVDKAAAKNASATLELEATHGSEAVAAAKSDFSKDIQRGVVVVREGADLLVSFGAKLHSDGTFLVPSRASQARLSLVIAAATSGTTARVKHLEVDVPGRALVSLEGDHCDCTIKNLSLAETRGGEVRLELDANVGSPPNAFKLHAVIRTFLRDIVKPEN